MQTSFHHQPEAQHPNFPLSTSWQADYPIYWHEADLLTAPVDVRLLGVKQSLSRTSRNVRVDPKRT
jgi:hypothetical protein